MKPGDMFKRVTGRSVDEFPALTAIDQAVVHATDRSLTFVQGGVWPVDTHTTSEGVNRQIDAALAPRSFWRLK